MVLADGLSYARDLDPRCVFDICTLTGAIIIALGHHTAGVMGTDQKVVNALLKSGRATDDVRGGIKEPSLIRRLSGQFRISFSFLSTVSPSSCPPLLTGLAAPMLVSGAIAATWAASVTTVPAEAAIAPGGAT